MTHRSPLGRPARAAAAAAASAAAAILSLPAEAAADFVVSPFDHSGFEWTYDDFTQTLGPTAVTLSDPTDGWGGGGITYDGLFDFSPYADGHFRVDFRKNAANASNEFTLALRDSTGNQGKWQFNVADLPGGTWQRLTAATPLSRPQFGNNDWQNLDLSHIRDFELLGQWSGAPSFDMSFGHVEVQTDGFVERYPGHAPDAPWRQEAAQRIDQVRKADMRFVVTDPSGNRLDDAQVQVRMRKHAFGFGSALVLGRLTGTSATDAIYRDKVRQLFNTAGNENDLKWPAWAGEWGSSFTQQKALAGLDWLADNGIEARGHVMVWPGRNNLPSPIRSLIDEYNATTTSDARRDAIKSDLRQRVLDHIADIGGKTAGKLAAWDVVNEPRSNHDLMDILGADVMADWFDAARAANPQARLFINEYNIVTSGGTHPAARDLYESQIKALQAAGAPIGGIGMQGHFGEGSLTGPETVWGILDRFHDSTGLPIQITEYDFGTTDRQLQADFLRDFMTAVFAHEGVTDFIQWGFWAGAHWRPDAAMFDEDWNLRPHGQEYLRLVFDEWWTNQDLLTDGLGEADLRAFLGDYEVTVLHGRFEQTYQLTLAPGGGTYELVLVPEPAGALVASCAALLLLTRRHRRVA